MASSRHSPIFVSVEDLGAEHLPAIPAAAEVVRKRSKEKHSSSSGMSRSARSILAHNMQHLHMRLRQDTTASATATNLSLVGVVSVTVTPGGTPLLRRRPPPPAQPPPRLGHEGAASSSSAFFVSRSESALAPAPAPRDDEDDVGCVPLVLTLPVVLLPSTASSAPSPPPRLPACLLRRGRASGGPCLRQCDRPRAVRGLSGCSTQLCRWALLHNTQYPGLRSIAARCWVKPATAHQLHVAAR